MERDFSFVGKNNAYVCNHKLTRSTARDGPSVCQEYTLKGTKNDIYNDETVRKRDMIQRSVEISELRDHLNFFLELSSI